MAIELASPVHFARHAVNLGLITYSDAGEKDGAFVKWLEPRDFVTFENYVYSLFSETQLESFVKRIVVSPTMDPAQEEDAMMGSTARNLRILHARGLQIIEKTKAADKLQDYEWGPGAFHRHRIHALPAREVPPGPSQRAPAHRAHEARTAELGTPAPHDPQEKVHAVPAPGRHPDAR